MLRPPGSARSPGPAAPPPLTPTLSRPSRGRRLALGPALLWRPLPVTMATPGPPLLPRAPQPALPARGRPRRDVAGRGQGRGQGRGRGQGGACPVPRAQGGSAAQRAGMLRERRVQIRLLRLREGEGTKATREGAGSPTTGFALSPGPGNPPADAEARAARRRCLRARW